MRTGILYLIIFCLAAGPDLAAAPVQTLPGVVNAAFQERETAVLHQIHLLNQIAPDQLDEKADPALSIIRSIYDQDSPDFAALRKTLSKADVRSSLNPSAKAVLASLISQRWDAFTLAGNLWLAALRSPKPDLRYKARKRLVAFVQPAHIPVLIDTLRIPGPNVLAYEILQEVTGQSLEPNIKIWQGWWAKMSRKADLVGHLLKDTKGQLQKRAIRDFDPDRFWYAPAPIKEARIAFASRSLSEQSLVMGWTEWANTDVREYVEEWSAAKPIIDRIIHQPDPRVNAYLERLVGDPGYGDYVSVVLAWRAGKEALPAIQAAYRRYPTVGRALARGSLGDKEALEDLLNRIEKRGSPLSFYLMDDALRAYAQTLRTVGVIPAEQAFELLTHHVFDFENAGTRSEKKKVVKKAKRWLAKNGKALSFDRRRGYYVSNESLPQQSTAR